MTLAVGTLEGVTLKGRHVQATAAVNQHLVPAGQGAAALSHRRTGRQVELKDSVYERAAHFGS
jgi:hypothetical protein